VERVRPARLLGRGVAPDRPRAARPATGGVLCDNPVPLQTRSAVDFQELLAFAGRHQMLSLIFVGLTGGIILNEIFGLLRPFKGVRPSEVSVLVNRENALVVDLRPIADFDKGHIPGSKNVQMSQFDPENKKLAAARALPVVLVCKTGFTAGDAAKRLKKAGFERVYVLEGGIGSWLQAELPLARGRD
jgi:rhodanese-related sulfurtransferase